MTNLPVILPTGTQVVVHIDIQDASGDVLFASTRIANVPITKPPTITSCAHEGA